MIYMLTPNTLSDLLISPSFVSLCPHISPTNQSTVSAHLTSCPPISEELFPCKIEICGGERREERACQCEEGGEREVVISRAIMAKLR